MTMAPAPQGQDPRNDTDNSPAVVLGPAASKHSNLGGLQLNSIHVGSGADRHRYL